MLPVDMYFVVQGLQRLKMLKDLEIVIEAAEVEQSLISEFETKLQEVFDRIGSFLWYERPQKDLCRMGSRGAKFGGRIHSQF